jgi:hypothetical protein
MKKTNICGEDKMNQTCFGRCKYNFTYKQIASCNAINQGNMIQLDYPENNNENIVYDNLKYTPRQIFIYYPSYFNYYDQNNEQGKKADAEISIYHTNATSAPLIVNIPIYINTNTNTEASLMITEIITNVSKNAPIKNEQTTIKFNSNFSLKGIIPVKPFYNFYDNTKSSNCVIFGKENSISISSDSYNNMLTKILNSYNSSSVQDIDNGPFIYYNAKGPNANPEDNEIYISCNPTGNSEETKTMVYEKPATMNESSSSTSSNEQTTLFLTKFFQSIYGITLIIFVIIIIIVIIYIGFQKYLESK